MGCIPSLFFLSSSLPWQHGCVSWQPSCWCLFSVCEMRPPVIVLGCCKHPWRSWSIFFFVVLCLSKCRLCRVFIQQMSPQYGIQDVLWSLWIMARGSYGSSFLFNLCLLCLSSFTRFGVVVTHNTRKVVRRSTVPSSWRGGCKGHQIKPTLHSLMHTYDTWCRATNFCICKRPGKVLSNWLPCQPRTL